MTYKEMVDAYMLLVEENNEYKRKLRSIKISLKGTVQIIKDNGDLDECVDILNNITIDIKEGNVL